MIYEYFKNQPKRKYETPDWAVEYLIPYLDKSWKVWECACGSGFVVKVLQREGFSVVGTDIEQGYDFMSYIPDWEFDVIITNPPYDRKDDFIERCYWWAKKGKKFALLIPLTSLEGIRRQFLYKTFGVQLLLLPKRVNFIAKDAASGAWFPVGWFCYGLETLRDIKIGEIYLV